MDGSAVDFSEIGVMIVDDNRHMRSLLTSIMHALGIKRLKEAADGETALTEIAAFEPHSDKDRVREARDSGVNEFLTKPVSAKSLLARLITIIESPRPFIKTESYFGPDRRRQDIGAPDGQDDRRAETSTAPPRDEADASPEELLAS